MLFGREFEFDEVLAMWDVLFAEDPTLEIVDFICLVMIIRLHWDRKFAPTQKRELGTDPDQYLRPTIM